MRTFSLRGTYELTDNAIGQPLRIFDYVSPDRTRAWKVVSATIWPSDSRADTSSDADGKYLTQATLMTEYIKGSSWGNQMDPADNRVFGWGYWAGYTRENGSSDFIISNDMSGQVQMTLDPDTIVVKELLIAMSNTKEGTVNPSRRWGFLIILEEVKITPSQSVFQQLKGMGQNIGGPSLP